MDKQKVYEMFQVVLWNSFKYDPPPWIINEMDDWLKEFGADFQMNQITNPFELIERLAETQMVSYTGKIYSSGVNPLSISMCFNEKDKKRAEICRFLSACNKFVAKT